VLPAGLAGERNLVFLALGRDHQPQVDTWVDAAKALEASVPGLRFYEAPLIGPVNFALKAVIAGGMKLEIGDEVPQSRTVPLFVERGPVLEALEITEEGQIRVLLIDRSGAVLWQGAGAWSAGAEASLRAVLVL
jgi:hypothetical protein